MEREASDPGAWFGRLVGRTKPAADPVAWDVSVRLVEAPDDDNLEMMIIDPDVEPAVDAVAVKPGEAPWEMAARLLGASQASRSKPLIRLVRVAFATGRPAATFMFAPVN